MNSRERVRAVLNHQIPDRVPNGLGERGNYIFAGVHNLPATLPESHLKAMIDAYRDAREY
ncbi:MAG: hypothetical protein IKM18_09085 [Clostridia bacterium]|nr:hypothetical protein [Clostridia bacterium]